LIGTNFIKKKKMSNLIKATSVNLPKEVSNLSKTVYQANSSVMIKNVGDMNVVVNSIHQSINRAIADKGVNMLLEDMEYLKRSITDDILRDFTTLSLQDVNLCFSMGVRGNLGEYFGVNVVSLYGWLKKYKEEILPKMFSEVKAYLPSSKEVEKVIDYKALDLEKIENICSAINLFKQEKIYVFNDFGNIHYNFLNRFNYFDSVSDDDKLTVKEGAKTSLINKTKDSNMDLIAQGKKIQMIDIGELFNKIERGEKDTETVIEIIYRKLMIKNLITSFNFKDLEKLRSELITKVQEHYEK
tara:strand:+ start:504 stop:1400 length:897 start_codon:yes stop_codon:yes gene_type:complete